MGAFRCAALTVSCLLAGWPAVGRPAPIDAGGSLAVTEDDVYRGVSQTCGHPAAQADLHVRAHGPSYWAAFAGVWGSLGLSGGGSSPCGGARELDAYLGYSLALTADLSATFTYTRYNFPGGGYGNPHVSGDRYDYDQIGTSWSLADRLYLNVAWTPDALSYHPYEGIVLTRQNRSAFSYGVEWRQPLVSWLSASAGAGYDQMADPFNTGYGFWSVGLTHTRGPFELDLTYFHTAPRAVHLFGPSAAGGRASVTVLWRF